jgi:diadenosine tetraphosphate (Ap4A) HIT family hydrolase
MTALTAIDRMVARCRANDFTALVGKLDSGWVVMGERQVFAGYCLLLPDPVAAHLNALEAPRQLQFLGDMARLGDALLEVTGATRINYAIFGNVEPALHAHAFPRHASEAAATRTQQPWALDWSLSPAYSEAEFGELRRRIAARLS